VLQNVTRRSYRAVQQGCFPHPFHWAFRACKLPCLCIVCVTMSSHITWSMHCKSAQGCWYQKS
jgi:hypothetical protein